MGVAKEFRSMGVAFKALDESDLYLILNLMDDFYRVQGLSFECQATRTTLIELMKDKSLGHAWIIYDDRVPVGYVIITFSYCIEYHGRNAFLDELYIQSDFRRQGIGVKTMKFIKDACNKHGIKVLHLRVDREDVGAQCFYRNAGFEDYNRCILTKWMEE